MQEGFVHSDINILFAKNVVLRPAVAADTAIQKKIYFFTVEIYFKRKAVLKKGKQSCQGVETDLNGEDRQNIE
jgi:hypothetical protein